MKGGGRGKNSSQRQSGGRGRMGQRANAAQTHVGGAATSTARLNEIDGAGLPGLSNDQWKVLLQELKGIKPNSTKKMTGKQLTWIIDTGASNHMKGTLEILHDMREISSCQVGLPDGS